MNVKMLVKLLVEMLIELMIFSSETAWKLYTRPFSLRNYYNT